LLRDLAVQGNGAFAFIPCPGFVGTIFVNSVANILTTMGRNATVKIHTSNGVKIKNIIGDYKYTANNHDAEVNVGNLLYG